MRKLIVIVLTVFCSVVLAKKDQASNDQVSNAYDVSLKKLESQVRSLQHQIAAIKKDRKEAGKIDAFEEFLEKSGYGMPVFSSPSFGVRSNAYDADDLMVNLSSVNRDLVLLKQMQKMDNYVLEHGGEISSRPIIILSGAVEGLLANESRYNNSDKTDVNLSRAELDVVGKVGSWATASMVVSYDDDYGVKDSDTYTRVNNSRIYIDRAFLTIGNLNKFPAYTSLGQLYAPFGSFSSYMVTNPMIKKLGRTKERMMILGYHQHGVTVQAYGLAGATKRPSGSSQSFSDHTGANLAYNYVNGDFNLNVGGSIIGNLAESDEMQSLFGKSASSEVISSRVHGLDARVKFNYDPFTVLAEYVGAHKKFDVTDLSFNNNGAKPQAFSVEGAFEFKIKDRPNTIAIGYGQTWESLALSLPKNCLFAVYNIALIKNTIFSLEYRHDINYGWNDVANSVNNANPITVIGRHNNIVTAQMGVYF